MDKQMFAVIDIFVSPMTFKFTAFSGFSYNFSSKNQNPQHQLGHLRPPPPRLGLRLHFQARSSAKTNFKKIIGPSPALWLANDWINSHIITMKHTNA